MKVHALLPMKAHSERVKNKNIRLFCGKPLYHQIASILEASEFIDLIIINTDSKFIAEDAKNNFSKVKIIDRPANLQGDFVSMNEIIAHDIKEVPGEHFLQTHSTNPLLSLATLNRAIRDYFENLKVYDSLFSVTKLLTRLYWPSGEPVNHNPTELIRTQDLPFVYEENSSIYIFSKNSFIQAGSNRIGLKPRMFETNKIEAIDIDTEEDFLIAETFYLRKYGGMK